MYKDEGWIYIRRAVRPEVSMMIDEAGSPVKKLYKGYRVFAWRGNSEMRLRIGYYVQD